MKKKIIAVIMENGRRVEKEIEVLVSGKKTLYEEAKEAVNALGSAITIYGFFHRNADGSKGDKIS